MRFLVAVLVLAACGDSAADAPDAATGADAAVVYPPPRTDLVPRVGSDGAIDLAAWNIENFPKDARTPEHVANLIASMDLDLLSIEEVQDVAAFDELVARLPDHAGVLSTHTYGDGTYQKIGIVYREDLLSVTDQRLLFSSSGYEFPRPPLQVTAAVTGTSTDFTVIAVHLKAGFQDEDRSRRTAAVQMLEGYVADQVAGDGDADVIVIGDFNEVLTSSGGRATMGPWLDAPSAYVVRTDPLAQDDQVSFLPSGVILDHVITTTSLDDELAGGDTVIPRLDTQFVGYVDVISDHLPVVTSMPNP